MTQRERSMLNALLGLLGLVVVFGVIYFAFLGPWMELGKEEEQIQDSMHKKQIKLTLMMQDRKMLYRAKERSLPLQPHQAAIEYDRYLSSLLKEAGLSDLNFQGPSNLDAKSVAAVGPRAKKITQTPLGFSVRARGTLPQVVRSLELMQNTPVLHRVKRLTLDRIDPKDSNGLLSVAMEVEALILQNIPPLHKPSLAPTVKMDPPGTHPERVYADAGKRNFFLGYTRPIVYVGPPKGSGEPKKPVDPPDDVDACEYVRLDHTVPSADEAYIRNLLVGGQPMRIGPKTGFDSIKIFNESRRKVLVQGKVLKIEQRDVYFSVGDKIYAWHIGNSIAQAMRQPMTEAELREVGLFTESKSGKKKDPEEKTSKSE